MLSLPREARQRLGQAGRAHIEAHYRIDDAIAAYIALYRAVAHGVGPAGPPV
jgi:glycosyltransferase involved in cell wall biosynthesis